MRRIHQSMQNYFNEKIEDSSIWKYFQENLRKCRDESIFNNVTVPNDSREAKFIRILEEWRQIPRHDKKEAQNKLLKVMDLLKETEIYQTIRTHYVNRWHRINQENLPYEYFDEQFRQIWGQTYGFQHFYIGESGSGLHGWQGLCAVHKNGRLSIERMSGTGFKNLHEVNFKCEETAFKKTVLFGLPFEYEMLEFSLPLLFLGIEENSYLQNGFVTYVQKPQLGSTVYNCLTITPGGTNRQLIKSAYFVKEIDNTTSI